MFDTGSGELQQATMACVESLMHQHGQVPTGSPIQRNVEDAFSTLVQGIGVEKTWGVLSFWPEAAAKGIGTERAWIVATMKTAAMTAQPNSPKLAFFQTTILNLARSLDRLAAATTKKSEIIFHRARVIDLWTLFPCFCQNPMDVTDSLAALANVLFKALEDKRYPQLVSIISRALSVLSDSVSNSASETDKNTMSQVSQKLLPIMFKIITSSSPSASGTGGDRVMDVDSPKSQNDTSQLDQGQQTQILSEAIANLSRHAPPQFLHALFKKLMHRLLDEVQSESRDDDKICAYLSLSLALVASETLDEANISFLYRTIKPFIRTDEYGARCQKKAYKVMAELCERNHSFFTDLERLKEMTALLTGTIATSQVAARHMRLKCLKHIVDGLDKSQAACLSEIGNVLAENLLCLKDTNAKTREAAYQLLIALASKSQLDVFLQSVTAALGAETPHMRSAAVMALSRIVFEFAWEDPALQALLPSLLRTVLILMNENSREVIKSVVGFIRVSVAAIPREQLEPLLPELIQSLLGYHKTKDRFRAKIKIILKKLVKQYGYDLLMPHVPENETRLLTHMRKLDERRRRKKEALKESERPGQDLFEEMVESDEDDSDDGRTLATGLTGFTKMTSRSSKMSMKLGSKSVASKTKGTRVSASAMSTKTNHLSTLQLPNEVNGEVVDMLGANMAKRVKFVDDQASRDDDDDSDGAMEFDDDGRLVIHDEVDMSEKPSRIEQPTKKQRTSRFESAKVERNRKGNKKTKQLGAAYKSKKAGGDVKRKDQKFEPYAFVPLDGKSYSKRNRRTAVENMGSVVRQGRKRKQS
uniref:TOG domain-containing protein n=1 Tax=Entomoneis paludosa TaxID=265537 RepID=A0A7S3DVE2_9STRA